MNDPLQKYPPLFAALLVTSLALGACRDKADQASKPAAETPTPGADDPPPVAETPIDVSILVKPCIESGIDAGKCKCAGKEAETIIGRALLAKMAKAPLTDVDAYYSVSEMNTIMSWVDSAAKTCGIEEEA